MTFASFQFAIFFPVVVAAYYLCPASLRWALLLAASCYFYTVFIPPYLLVLFGLIFIDYAMALLIERSKGAQRRYYLWVSIGSTAAILFIFKYFNFFNENLSALAHIFHWNYSVGALHLLLPLGLSFHTFQSLSYVIEVYKGRFKAERHFGIYALYVMFFPQLVAGPIERPQHLLPQLRARVSFDVNGIISGLRLMAWGFFKKLVIADRLALSVDYTWQHFSHLPGPSILSAMVFFAFQLYADFSGYSDIARGSARVLGIEVVQNFAQPYFSASIPEFWRRWHISLSSWFRDYVFTPLAFTWRNVYAATLFTFVVIGLWHGANWTFICMGALFGIYIALALAIKKWPPLPLAARQLLTFLLVAFTWTFFRAPDFSAAISFIGRAFLGWHLSFAGLLQTLRNPADILGLSQSALLISIGAVAILLVTEYGQGRFALSPWFNRRHLIVRSALYTAVVLVLIIYSVVATKQFIYFQF